MLHVISVLSYQTRHLVLWNNYVDCRLLSSIWFYRLALRCAYVRSVVVLEALNFFDDCHCGGRLAACVSR